MQQESYLSTDYLSGHMIPLTVSDSYPLCVPKLALSTVVHLLHLSMRSFSRGIQLIMDFLRRYVPLRSEVQCLHRTKDQDCMGWRYYQILNAT